MIILKKINFKYPNGDIVFNDTNIKIFKNKITGIIGPSGSGKSTLLYLLSGLYVNSNIEIYVNNKKSNFTNLQKISSIVDQSPTFLETSIKDNVAFGLSPDKIDINLVKSSLIKVQLSKFTSHKNIIKKINENGSNFSGGEKQRIALARAIYFKKKVLLLDEITNGLNLSLENEILKLIKNLKNDTTIVFITHNKKSLTICDHIYEVKDKKLKKL